MRRRVSRSRNKARGQTNRCVPGSSSDRSRGTGRSSRPHCLPIRPWLSSGTTRTSRSSSHPNSHRLHQAIRPVKTLRGLLQRAHLHPLDHPLHVPRPGRRPRPLLRRPREPGHDVPEGLPAAFRAGIIGDPMRSDTDDDHARTGIDPLHPRRPLPRARAVSIPGRAGMARDSLSGELPDVPEPGAWFLRAAHEPPHRPTGWPAPARDHPAAGRGRLEGIQGARSQPGEAR